MPKIVTKVKIMNSDTTPLDEKLDGSILSASDECKENGCNGCSGGECSIFKHPYSWSYKTPAASREEVIDRAFFVLSARAEVIREQKQFIRDIGVILNDIKRFMPTASYTLDENPSQNSRIRAISALFDAGIGEEFDDKYLETHYTMCAVCRCKLCMDRIHSDRRSQTPFRNADCCGHEYMTSDKQLDNLPF